MKKQLKETTIYKPNESVTVTVNNKPVTLKSTGEIMQEHTVTIKVVHGFSSEKLSFNDTDSLSDFINNIDIEEEQQHLALGQ